MGGRFDIASVAAGLRALEHAAGRLERAAEAAAGLPALFGRGRSIEALQATLREASAPVTAGLVEAPGIPNGLRDALTGVVDATHGAAAALDDAKRGTELAIVDAAAKDVANIRRTVSAVIRDELPATVDPMIDEAIATRTAGAELGELLDLAASSSSYDSGRIKLARSIVDGGGGDPGHVGWITVAADDVAARFTTADQATARLDQLLDTPTEQWTRADLFDLAGLHQLDESVRPSILKAADAAVAPEAFTLSGNSLGSKASTPGVVVAEQVDLLRLVRRWPTREASSDALASVLAQGYDDVDADGWIRLRELAQLPDTARPDGLTHPSDHAAFVTHLDEVAEHVRTGATTSRKWTGWPILDRAAGRARFTTREAADARLAEIAAVPPSELTRRDLHDLSGLLQLPEDRRPLALAHFASREHARAADVSRAAEQVHQGIAVSAKWDGWKSIHEMRRLIRWPDPDSASAALGDVLARGYDEMTVDDWRTLQQLALLPTANRPQGLAYAKEPGTLATQFGEVAVHVGDGTKTNKDWGGWRILDRLGVQRRFPDQESAAAHLAELVAKPRTSLTRQDLHDLGGLLQLEQGHRPEILGSFVGRANAGHADFARAGEMLHRGEKVNDTWGGWGLIDQVAARLTWPDRESATAAAADVLAKGYDDMDVDDWFRLQRIGRLPDDTVPEPIGPRGQLPSIATQLGEVAVHVRDGKPTNVDWGGWARLDELAAGRRFADGPDSMRDLIRSLGGRPHEELTRHELHGLAGALSLDDATRPEWMRGGNYAQTKHFATQAERHHLGKKTNEFWAGYKHVDEWVDQVALDDAIAADGGDGAAHVRGLLDAGDEGEALDALAKVTVLRPDLLPADQAPAQRLLTLSLGPMRGSAQLARHGRSTEPWLHAVGDALAALPAQADPNAAQIVDRLQQATTANLRRLEQATKDTPNAFADMASIGAMGADLRMLAMLSDETLLPAGGAAARVADEAADAAGALQW